MFYLIHGKDFKKRVQKKEELLKIFHEKRPHSEVFTLDPEDFEERFFDEFLFSQGLFETKNILWGSGLLSDKETKEVFDKDRLFQISKSPNVFLFLEDHLTKAQLKKFENKAERVFDVGEEKKEVEEKKFNNFSLADAFGKRDKKGLWVLYQKALRGGAVPEELHGILFWQVKTMILASSAKSASEAGVSPFPFQKAKSFLKNFKVGELENISARLVSLYHDAHRGKVDFREGLETFILTL